MAVKLRLRRMGRRKRPLYALVASDARSPRDGRFIEDLGRYNPVQEPAVVAFNDARVLYWLNQGAEPTDTVRNLLNKQGLLLGASLIRKGQSQEEAQAAIEQHRSARAAKAGATKLTAAQRRQQALREERERVAKEEAERARQRAEADAQAKREAEEAQRHAAEERLAAAEAAAAEAAAAPAAEAEATPVEEAAPEAPEASMGADEAAAPEAAADTAEPVKAGEDAGATTEETAGEEPAA